MTAVPDPPAGIRRRQLRRYHGDLARRLLCHHPPRPTRTSVPPRPTWGLGYRTPTRKAVGVKMRATTPWAEPVGGGGVCTPAPSRGCAERCAPCGGGGRPRRRRGAGVCRWTTCACTRRARPRWRTAPARPGSLYKSACETA